MAFGIGQVANNEPVFFPNLPDISGNASNWDVIEWSKAQYLQPTSMQTNAPSSYNLLSGDAAYSWSTSDGESALQAYHLQAYQVNNAGWVYDLSASGGILSSRGGANLFLSAPASVTANFASPITYQIDARITQADIAYFNSTAASNGAVLAQVFTGFVATFNAPSTATYNSTLPTWTAFIQIPISASGGGASGALYDNVQGPSSGGGVITYSHLLPGESALAYEADSGSQHSLSYSLNAHLSDLIEHSGLGAAEQNMSGWTLGSMYIGLETETAIGNPAGTPEPQGSLAVGFEFANVSVVQDRSQTYSYGTGADAASLGMVNIISVSSGESVAPVTPPASTLPVAPGVIASDSSPAPGTDTGTPPGSTLPIAPNAIASGSSPAPGTDTGTPPALAASVTGSISSGMSTTPVVSSTIYSSRTTTSSGAPNVVAQGAPQSNSKSNQTIPVQASSLDRGASPVDIPPPAPANFLVTDTTTGQIVGDAGTVAGNGQTFVDLSPDNLCITAQAPNEFIQSGLGNDILIAQSGSNVLDSTGGTVNFLFGGSGTDTFFLNAQNNPVTWNTLVNFHAGDAAVVWGITPQDSQFSFADTQGVPAYSGLTLHEMASGRAAFITLAGYTGADLSNGKLAMGFGTNTLDERPYMLIVAG